SVAVGTTPVTSNGVGFDTLTLPLPVLYSGTLTIPGATTPTPVAGASIDSYIYMKAGQYTPDWTQADSVLEIGETVSDNDGNFTLYIPAALNAPNK
ncbi:MAG TPA: hypothetical protein VNW92_02975, partial [Polyangiaceae bacterium]|nr:hypothetical protein [Polyangiaceae bacterium]